ncbi:MAG: ROK family transcriptional regulator [Sphaerochaetaceae bacterium]|nr:ROK family transcriptional regulator [Sphaerochaetaceae bacterium]MDD3163400.1 ROK family transcriptional regulator [Sphaerochaetaceae bacterium]MDD4396554.1 ROK family transcriptional regulator [Sphaerochaetaceae bacterium]
MKLSQPQSARSINNYRVLNLVRRKDRLSKAELSRLLSLNKVSTGEIVDSLIEQGVIRETGKLASSNGRRATALELVRSSRLVLAVDIGPKFCIIALANLGLELIRFERIPTESHKTPEDFCVSIIKSCMRTIKLAPKDSILGMAITIPAGISSDRKTIERCSFLPWGEIPIVEVMEKALGIHAVLSNSLEALVLAENLDGEAGKCVFYVDWGERIDAALVKNKKVYSLLGAFGHLKVSQTGLCTCGQIGCLEAVASTWALSQSPDASLKDIWDKVPLGQALDAMATAFALASQVCGFDTIVIGGQGSTIPDGPLSKLTELFDKYHHPYASEAVILRSALGEKANIIAAADYALDQFFFHSGFLVGVEEML